MTRKDYIKLAAAIREASKAVTDTATPALTLAVVRDNICDVLAADNPLFDRARFIAAATEAN